MRMTRKELIAEVKAIEQVSLALIDRMSTEGDKRLDDDELLKELESLGCKVQRLITVVNSVCGHPDSATALRPPVKCFRGGITGA